MISSSDFLEEGKKQAFERIEAGRGENKWRRRRGEEAGSK